VFTSPSLVREEGKLPASLADELILPHLQTGVVLLKNAIGEEKYNALFALGANDSKFLLCRKAETFFSLSVLVHALNIETAGAGIVRIKGWDESRSELLSRFELNDLSKHFRKLAYEVLTQLNEPINTEDAPVSVKLSRSILMVV